MRGHYLPLATIAWGISLFYIFGNLEMLGGHTGMTGIPALAIGGFELKDERRYFYLIWAIALAALWTTNNLLDSRPGRAIRSLKGGLEMAEAFGVNAARLKIVAFVYRRAAGMHFRLALCTFAALRESNAVWYQSRHRIPVHGGGGRRRECLGAPCLARTSITLFEGSAAGLPAKSPRTLRAISSWSCSVSSWCCCCSLRAMGCGHGSRA